ncbi:MAG: M20 family dipeptidase [Chloroflexi bacterium]|nr:M20 family dipeptidase [Chloroflexota bacterium]
MTEDAIQQAVSYAESRQDAHMDGFMELLRIPSVSTDPAYKEDLERCAGWIVTELDKLGFEKAAAMPTEGHPIVYAEWLKAGDDKPTVLVYAHYDVQPVDPLELWDTPPFEPTIRDGKLFARGVIDDKCGVYINLKAFESIMATSDGMLPVNIKILFEGEEESGSPSVEPFIMEHKELLAADFMLICDAGSAPGEPRMFYTARGIIGANVTITGPIDYDIHSGVGGGMVINPLHVAGKMIAGLHHADGSVAIPGWFDDVKLPDEAERQVMIASNDAFRAMVEERYDVSDTTWGEETEPVAYIRATALPTAEVNGMWGGYQGHGGKTIIPRQAAFKITFRTVPDQDPEKLQQLFVDYIRGFETNGIKTAVVFEQGSWAVQLMRDEPPVQAIHKAFEATWGQRATMYRQGGSVPIMSVFQRALGMPIATLGFAVGAQAHAPNEYYELDWFFTNLKTAIHFYHYLPEEMANGA